MNRIIFFGSLLFILNSCSKQPDCESFKEGSFIVPIDTEGGEPYRIIRNDSLQTEIDSRGVKIYSTITWLNECSYILKYDENNIELKDYQKQINNVGGVIVNVTKTDGDCFYFTSKIKGEAESERIDGVMCKEKNKKELKVNTNSENLLSCTIDALRGWSEKVKRMKKSTYLYPKRVFTEYNKDSTLISVIWKYDQHSIEKEKDELIDYCLELVQEKIKLPKDFNIKFDYVINSSCPVEPGLPLETYSEVDNLSVFDNETLVQYDFDVIRGRVDAVVKYSKNEQGKL